MVMKIEPIALALDALRGQETRVLLMTPQGKRFNQKMAEAYSRESHLIIISGHYEGVDQRVADHLVDDEVSIGDILNNGALASPCVRGYRSRSFPAYWVMRKPGTRFIHRPPGSSAYARPENLNGWVVPEVLLSGNHAAIEASAPEIRPRIDPFAPSRFDMTPSFAYPKNTVQD